MNTRKYTEECKATIKIGVIIGQDFRYLNWPECFPPDSEFGESEQYEYKTKHPNRIFDCKWNGDYWDCIADGYGNLKKSGAYGNGSIFVFDYDGIQKIQKIDLKDESDFW